MLDWIIITAVVALALAYLLLRVARSVRLKRIADGKVHPSRPQGLTVGGKRVR